MLVPVRRVTRVSDDGFVPGGVSELAITGRVHSSREAESAQGPVGVTATSGAGQGGRKICALMTGEVAEPFRWLCSTGCMLKFFHVSTCHASVMCLGGPPWAATQEKVAACAELWGLIFLCRVKVHTVRVFQWPSWRALASQNLLGSGFLVHRTHPYVS